MDIQCHDGEHVVETGGRVHIGIAIELCIAIVIFYLHLYCNFRILQYHSAKSKIPGTF